MNTDQLFASSNTSNNSLSDNNLIKFDFCLPKRRRLRLNRQLLPLSNFNHHNQSSNSIITTNTKQQQQLYQVVTKSPIQNSSLNHPHFSLKSNHKSNHHHIQSSNQNLTNKYRAFLNQQPLLDPLDTSDKRSIDEQDQASTLNDKISVNHHKHSLRYKFSSSKSIPIVKSSSPSSKSINTSTLNSLNSIRIERVFRASDNLLELETAQPNSDTILIDTNRPTDTDHEASGLIIPQTLLNYCEQENNSSLANSYSRRFIYQESFNSGEVFYLPVWLMGQKSTSVLKNAQLANGSPILNSTVQQNNQLNLSSSPSLLNTSGNSLIHSGHHSHNHSIFSNSSSSSSSGTSIISASTLHSSTNSGSPTNGNLLGNSTISSNQSVISSASQQQPSSNSSLWRGSNTNKNNISNLNNNNNNNSKNTIYNECNELIGQRPSRLDTILDMPPVSHEEQVKNSWNPDDRSLNIFVKDEDPFTLHRHPVAQSTDCIRGRVGYTRGLHVFQIHWNVRQRGTHATVGVCTIDAALHAQGYQTLIGCDENSYGYDLCRNKLYHDMKNCEVSTYPAGLSSEETLVVPDEFLVVLDMDEGTLSFVVDGQYLGVAFSGLKGKKLYPVVSAVWGHCEITMKYYGGLDPEPFPLKDICRRAIRMQVGKQRLHRIHKELMLPNALKSYLLYQDMKR